MYSFQNTHTLSSWSQHTRPISLYDPRELVEYRKRTERKIFSKKIHFSEERQKVKSEAERNALNLCFSFGFLLKVKENPVFFCLSSFALYLFVHLPSSLRFLDRRYFGNAKYLLLMFIHYLLLLIFKSIHIHLVHVLSSISSFLL